MTPLFDNQEYYKKMLELQEKLRKSEEERIRLEERFNLLEQESRIRHEACINKLRMRYIEFLEEQRSRDERNRKLLGALDRVDSSLAVMSAKTDKLYSLRKEYDASILRAHACRRQTPSVTGDSGILSQADDRRLQKYPSPPFPSASLSTLLHPRRVHSPPAPSPPHPKPLSYPPRPTIDFHDRFPSRSRDLSATWGLPSLNIPHSEDLDSLRRTPRYPKDPSPFQYPETVNPLKPSRLISTSLLSTPNCEDEKTGNAVENELERYISKIRSLHGDLEHSQEDHEQNTSGDLLNVTLSDDGLDHLPPEDKTRGLPDEVEKVLALAEDLASRTMEPPEKSPTDPPGENLNPSETNEHQRPEEIKSIAKDLEIERSQNADLTERKINETSVNPGSPEVSAGSALNIAEEVVNNDDVEELEPWSPESVQAHVEEVLINQEGLESGEAKSASETGDKNNSDDSGDKDNSVMGGDRDDVAERDANLASDGGGEPREEGGEGGQGAVQYPEGNYDGNAGYDYGGQGEGYQYAEGYQYNYDENGEVVGGGYSGGGEQYQGDNYEANVEYQQESYPEGSNVQYSQGNYGEGGGGEYQEGSYEGGDGHAQYQEGSYPQEGNYPQYEESSQQYQGEYPQDGNQGYDASGYGYSYEQEGYQEYQEAQASGKEEGGTAELVQQVEGPSAGEEGVEEESKKKKDVIKSILESETESSIEKNTENTESDFDFN
ncbi:interleukin enhancer-binding factor 3 [Diachasma alloeum]|uniref:interleukin enhancer-binding factor 3 n=1 Tax=Diachasma alloeum TaxID=454923 RepID=UPI0007381762|nr:interleukin enhancer-binding factor 3 [Diachasma alloeum]